MVNIYANKAQLEKAKVCHRNSVDRMVKSGKLLKIVIKGGSADGKEMYLDPKEVTLALP